MNSSNYKDLGYSVIIAGVLLLSGGLISNCSKKKALEKIQDYPENTYNISITESCSYPSAYTLEFERLQALRDPVIPDDEPRDMEDDDNDDEQDDHDESDNSRFDPDLDDLQD